MKLIKLHLLVAAMIIVTSGCVGSGKKYKQQENSAAGVVDSKNKDCYGTYEGILPCADCGGIKTTLKINSDATYDLRSEYLGEENGIFEESGVYNMISKTSLNWLLLHRVPKHIIKFSTTQWSCLTVRKSSTIAGGSQHNIY